jgi:hypothetical protein
VRERHEDVLVPAAELDDVAAGIVIGTTATGITATPVSAS